jgi:hypothetical protein
MQGPVVLDTPVAIKWFRHGEVLAEPALALRDAYLDGQFEVTLPSLLTYELVDVLRDRTDLTTQQVRTAVGSLLNMGWGGSYR